MNFLRKKFEASPEYSRIVPFGVFVALTVLQGKFGEDSRYWMYLLKTLGGAWLVWEMRPFVEEMRWVVSWEAVVVGVSVCALWVGLDGLYPRLSKLDEGWNPHRQFGQGTTAAWFYITVRIGGCIRVDAP